MPECYPPSNDPEEYPELAKLSQQWLDFFDEIEKPIQAIEEVQPGDITLDAMLSKHVPAMAPEYKRLNDLVDEVLNAVNSDKAFWDKLREVILPLYNKCKQEKEWQDRWNKILLIYDPCPLTVKTTQMWTNKKTGERKRGDVIRETELPPGFVMKI